MCARRRAHVVILQSEDNYQQSVLAFHLDEESLLFVPHWCIFQATLSYVWPVLLASHIAFGVLGLQMHHCIPAFYVGSRHP